ncbi:MAG: hypothetical protein K6F61_04120 [Clostridiales bacterium]|nr:hypothetical protein [Clostridiales bacterium]
MSIDRTISRLKDIKSAFESGDPIIAKEDIETIDNAVDYLREYAEMIIDIWSKVGTAKEGKHEHIE